MRSSSATLRSSKALELVDNDLLTTVQLRLQLPVRRPCGVRAARTSATVRAAYLNKACAASRAASCAADMGA